MDTQNTKIFTMRFCQGDKVKVKGNKSSQIMQVQLPIDGKIWCTWSDDKGQAQFDYFNQDILEPLLAQGDKVKIKGSSQIMQVQFPVDGKIWCTWSDDKGHPQFDYFDQDILEMVEPLHPLFLKM